MMDLSHLTDEEKKKILEVLQRDEVLRKEEENRVRKLRIQLQELRQKGVIKSDSGDSGKTCARCRESLGLIFNTGETCPKCQHKVCKRCKVNRQSWDKSWLCIICDKQRDIKGKTGDWFYEKVPQVNKIKLFGSEVIQTSINKNSLAQGYSSLVSSEEQREFQKTQQNLTNAPTGETVIDNGSLSSSLLKSSHENSSFGAYGKAKGNTESENNSIVSESSGYYDRSLQEHSHPNEHCTPESQSKFEHYRVHELKRHSSLDTDYSSSQSSLRNYNNRMDSPTTVSLTASDTAHRVKNGHDLYDNLSDIGGDSLHDSDIHSSCTSNAILHTTRGPGDGADSEKDKQSSHLVSDLSDSEPEAITEAMTGVAFHRMTLKSQQRSPLHVSGDNNAPFEHDSLAGRGDYSHHKDKLGEKRPLTLLEIAQSRSYSKRKESNGSAPVVEVDSVSDSTGENEDIDKHFRSHSKSATSSPVMMSNLSATTSGSVDSLTSFYSSAGERNLGKITITGDVKFDMTYNYKTGIFEVKIIACRDLAPVDTRKNFSDPYVKLYLLPDKTKNGKRKTKVKKHTLNPHYDEVLKYVISESELQTRTLWISAWHNDAFGHNDFLGEIQLPLDDINFEEFHATWRPLSPRAAGAESTLSYKGDLSLALRFVYPEIPTSGSPPNNIPRQTIGRKKKPKGSGDGMQGVLHVHFKGAKNLIAVRINGYSDPFAKCYLLPNRSRAGKRKTEVLRKNCNPQWNQMFVYEGLTLEDLKERALEITLWDRESVTSNDFLGGLRLGIGSGKSYSKEVKWQDSRLEEIDLWKRMLECPNKWVDGDISLRSHMNGKEAKEPHYV
ncbi:synaptotagmin-like protein 4 isoform X3 [Ptychodera flava]|uniref:synaptotagmin-like protein 4 isoform X3 n=1 Tax=Ptychodera flava TaxID=63121 RepID=UPI00396A697A